MMDNQLSLLSRLWIYQKERFPVFSHGLLIASFTFSAMAFSDVCRNGDGFELTDFLKAFVNTFTIFILLRISDEFKDKDYDRLNRPGLPVPRGLIKLSELRVIGLTLLGLLILFNSLLAPAQLLLFALVLAYLFLMFNEFFTGHWLSAKPLLYVTSHMLIIPLVDTLASSFDWMNDKADINGLVWFFAVSFFNGCTLELGRKIKSEDNEEANSYSKSLGFKKALLVFQLVLAATFAICIGASVYADLSVFHYVVFTVLYISSAGFGLWFGRNRTLRNAKIIEAISGLWAVLMYLNLGLGMYF